MKIQLQDYLQKTKPSKVTLDRKLNPIFQHIKINKINSIFQLTLDHSPSHLNIKKSAFHLTLPPRKEIFTSPIKEKRKMTIHEAQRIYKPKIKYNTAADERRTKEFMSLNSCRLPRASPEQKLILIPQTSKIKKHLIETVNIEAIQRVLYKKPRRISKFDLFCAILHERNRSASLQTPQSPMTARSHRKSRLVQNQLADQIYQTQKTQSNISTEEGFRITHRKKFWGQRTASKPIKGDADNESLTIRKMSQTINTNRI